MDIERNTKLFYEELENDCNPEKLLDLAKDNIFLYEPLFKYEKIKYHEYVIDISIYAKQYFMIYNDKQYESFKFFICSSKHPDYSICAILNEFLINKLINEKNHDFIFRYIRDVDYNFNLIYSNSFLSYLCKYNILSIQCLNLFSIKYNDIFYNIIDYFYFDNKNEYFNNINSFDIVSFCCFCKIYGYDINMLKFCVEQLKQSNERLSLNCDTLYRLPPFFSLDMLKKYTNALYVPNKLEIIIENKKNKHEKYIEDVMNCIYTDKRIIELKNSLNEDELINFYDDGRLSKYGFKSEIYENLSFVIKEKNNKNSNVKQQCYSIKENTCNMNKEDKFINTLPENIYPFYEKILKNPNKIELILNNPNYLLNLNLDLTNIKIEDGKYNFEKVLLMVVYIISLIHNKTSSFIIFSLLKIIYNYGAFAYYRKNKLIFTRSGFIGKISFSEKVYYKLTGIKHDKFRSYIDIEDYDY